MKEVPFFIERNTEQWQAMWGGLSEAELNSGDHVCENQETGDCWHYMGSDSNGHHFRHRKGVVAQMPVAAEVGSGDERDELGSG